MRLWLPLQCAFRYQRTQIVFPAFELVMRMLALGWTGAVVHLRDKGAGIFGHFHLVGPIVGIIGAIGVFDQLAKYVIRLFGWNELCGELLQR